jgi:5-methylcytosine-specific restriction endonuclease McrBC regulatory subunit McrC
VSIIREATPTYNRKDRQQIINSNIKPLHHPYYEDYKTLQHLCMQILQHEELKYGQDDDEIYGILFDGSWLWEEYLNTFLNPIMKHPRNREGIGKKYLFIKPHVSGVCYPDFYNHEMVLDAKYKGYSESIEQRQDLYQVISYMYIMQLKKGGFIVPVINQSVPKILKGYGGTIRVFGINIDMSCDSYGVFCHYMHEQEKALLDKIKNYQASL